MSATGKTSNLGSGQTFDTSVILISRILGIMNSCDFNLDDLFWHEFSPVPSAPRWWQYATTDFKSKLNNCLGVKQSLRTLPHPDVVMLDRCALLWYVYWPASGKMGILSIWWWPIYKNEWTTPMSIPCLTGITPTVQRILHGFEDHLRVLNSSSTPNTQSLPFLLNMFHWPS